MDMRYRHYRRQCCGVKVVVRPLLRCGLRRPEASTMKLTAQMSAILALVFGLVCLGVGVHGLWQAGEMTEAAAHADAVGFSWFWLFLAAVALATSALSLLMAKGRLGRLDS
jgi:hypothetical protein